MDGIDRDPLRAKLFRHDLGEVHHGGVTQAAADARGVARGHAVHVDDAPPPGALHVGGRLLSAAQVTHDLHVEVVAQHLLVQLRKGVRAACEAHTRGVVHEDVQPAERIRRVRHESHHVLRDAGVGAEADHAHAGAGGYLSGDVARCRFVAGADGHVDSLARKFPRDGVADAARASGYERSLAGYAEVHISPPWLETNGAAAMQPPR